MKQPYKIKNTKKQKVVITTRRTKMENQTIKEVYNPNSEMSGFNQNQKEKTTTLEEMPINITDQANIMVYTNTSVAVEKPIIQTKTEAVVEDVRLFKVSKKRIDSKGTEYNSAYFQVEITLKGGEKSIDNYSGIHIYDNSIWIGDKSDAGRLCKVIGKGNNLGSIISFLIKKRVAVITEMREFDGKKYVKNIILEII